MTEIDRRMLVTLAGAGLIAVAAQSRGLAQRSQRPTDSSDCELIPAGECYRYGDGVSSTATSNFQAELLCVVYIQFSTTGGGPIIQQKYVILTGHPTEPQLRILAQNVLEQIKGVSHNISFYRERRDFEWFSFDRPTYIVFFVDNHEGYARFNWHDSLSDTENLKHIIRFTPFSGHPGLPGEPRYKKRKLNKNFYGLKKWDHNSIHLAAAKVISVNYFNKDESNSPIQMPDMGDHRTWYVYSMNIHLQMATSNGRMIPVVLDPDTGNMGSQP